MVFFTPLTYAVTEPLLIPISDTFVSSDATAETVLSLATIVFVASCSTFIS